MGVKNRQEREREEERKEEKTVLLLSKPSPSLSQVPSS